MTWWRASSVGLAVASAGGISFDSSFSRITPHRMLSFAASEKETIAFEIKVGFGGGLAVALDAVLLNEWTHVTGKTHCPRPRGLGQPPARPSGSSR